MMRGVSTWAVAIRKPSLSSRERPRAGRRAGEIEVAAFPLVSWPRRHRAAAPAGHARRRRARRVAGDRLQGPRHLRQRPAAPRTSEEISGGTWAGTIVVALAFAIGLFFLVPVGMTSLFKDQLGSSLLFWRRRGAASARRSSSATSG